MTDEIKQILKSHGVMLESHGEMLKSHGEILKSHGEQLDLIAMKVVDHDEQLRWIKENMATRADISNISNTLDKIVNLAEKKDQEMTLLSHDLKLVEKDVRKMKPALGLS